MLWMMITAGLLLADVREKPTENGDPIGIATIDRRGTLRLQLRSVQCDGTITEGLYDVAPTDKTYRETLAWVGPIPPGGEKPLYAKDVKPCPKRR